MNAKNYPGGAFDPVLKDGRAGGRVCIEAQTLVFDSGSTTLTLALSGAELSFGGASNRLLFFSQAGQPERSFYVSDPEILNDPRLLSDPGLAAKIQVLKKNRKALTFQSWGLAALVLALGIGGIWIFKDLAADLIAKKVPVEWEAKLGDLVFKQLKVSGKEIESKAVAASLKRLAGPLLKHVPAEGFEFKLHLMEDGSLNAFALPGGHVILNSGLVMAAQTPEEILGVLAHECAHVTQRHGVKQLLRSLGVYILASVLLGDASGVLAVLLNNSSYLLTQKFSRDHEREADDEGWKTLLRAGIDPAGLIRFFELMEKKQKESLLEPLNGTLNFLSTHPATAERVARLKKRLKDEKHGAFRPVNFDLKAFKKLAATAKGE